MKGMNEKKAMNFLEKYSISIVDVKISIQDIDLKLKHNAFKKMKEKKLTEDYLVIPTKPSTFLNWPGNVKLDSTYVCFPKTKGDLIDILKHDEFTSIGFQGSTHSWPNFFGKSNSASINFLFFNAFGTGQERAKLVDKENGIVVVSAGCSILEKHCTFGLDKDPVLLPSCVIYTDGHYVGTTSTGCHVSSRLLKYIVLLVSN